MRSITASYRIVTPMFIGGANQDPSDGIRPPSFKGALRFWWRALNWGTFYQEYQNDKAAALKALHQKEGELFGSAAKDGKGGQGAFLIEIKQPATLEQDASWPKVRPMGESGFLGIGLWESGSQKKDNFQPHRVGLTSKEPFIVTLRFRNQVSNDDIESVKKSMKALGFLGGLGSRSRRGFGSLSLEEIDGEQISSGGVDAYKQLIHNLFSPLELCDVLPPFTAWSICSRIGMLKNTQKSGKDAHKEAAKLFYSVRGQKADVRGVKKRAFGQPLPLKPMKKEYDQRRASPLIFHIHPVGNQFICCNIFLPAQFLPREGFDMSFYGGVDMYMSKLDEVQL